MYTKIGKTKDGKTIYWGKKESGNKNSDDLTLWVTIGTPQRNGKNFHRVPLAHEKFQYSLFSREYKRIGDWIHDWHRYMSDVVRTKTSTQIKTW